MRTVILLLLVAFLLMGCRPVTAEPATSPVAVAGAQTVEPGILQLDGFIQQIHDPVIAKEGDTYYVFSTGARLIMICSKDMITWEWCGRVFEESPGWLRDFNRDILDLWAPDIQYVDGRWLLYYAGSSFGSPNSVIGLATNVTLDQNSPDYKWIDEGPILHSTAADDWNAIDPNLIIDEAGEAWMAFGSYWSGIKLRKLDRATGQLATDDTTLYALADRRPSGDNTAIEAAFIIHRGGYYYLFTSFDACCQGIQSTYNVRVGRSEAITGPYVDRDGVPMLEGGGTKILDAYDRWRGPGHNGFLFEDGVYWMVYHAYDTRQAGVPKLQIEAVQWDEEGWPYLVSMPEG